jgi:hypothetical protein
MFLWGENDKHFPPSRPVLAAQIPHARLEIISRSSRTLDESWRSLRSGPARATFHAKLHQRVYMFDKAGGCAVGYGHNRRSGTTRTARNKQYYKRRDAKYCVLHHARQRQ